MRSDLVVCIADDHPLVTDALEAVFRSDSAVEKVLKAHAKLPLLALLKNEQVDVLIQDVKFGDSDARTFISELKLDFSTLKIIVLTSLDALEDLQSILNLPVDGLVLKSESGSRLIDAMYAALDGHRYWSPLVSQRLNGIGSQPEFILSPREIQVLKGILQELNTRQIAEQIHVSEKTVEHYRASLFVKFDVKNVMGLVKKAILHGFW